MLIAIGTFRKECNNAKAAIDAERFNLFRELALAAFIDFLVEVVCRI